MIRLGLIGYPLGHSLSPALHTAALQACGLEGRYSLFPIQPDDKQGLKELLDRVRNREIMGLNVTIPHKQTVIEFLDELMPTAGAIGAVNTIYAREDKLIGDNTDAPGFLADLKKFLTMVPFTGITLAPCGLSRTRAGVKSPRHRKLNALILGAGGSARAVVYALANAGWNIYLAARRVEQADQLADSFINYHLPVTVWDLSTIVANLQSLTSPLSLIVNTTPAGMTPNIDESPWPENIPLPPDAVIYDLVYNPRQTRLVREARSQGRPATTGLGMLIEQAALAFEIWTGQNPSREVMRASVEQSPVSTQSV